ncbi:MAG: YcxB family protein [Clostridia bacterium]|nr:YcxB family protein [Clostridia bacterium]
MTVEFTVSEQDFIDLNLYHALYSKQGKKKRCIGPLLCLAIFFGFARGDLLGIGAAWTMAAGLVSAIAAAFLTPKLWQETLSSSIRKQVREGKCGFIGRWQLTLKEDYIEEITTNTTAYIKHDAVNKIECMNYRICVYVSPIQVLPVPLSAFVNNEQRDAFLAILKNKTGLSVSGLP